MLTNHPNMLGRGVAGAVGPGTGDVVGPASSTDNAITRFNGTDGKLIQNSTAILNDGTLSNSSGTEIFLNLPVTVSTSGTGGWTGIRFIATASSDNGSGTKLLMQLGTAASASLVTVSNAGLLRAASTGVGSSGTTPDGENPLHVTGDRNGNLGIQIYNLNSGSGDAARAWINLRTDSGSGAISCIAASYSTSGLLIADSMRIGAGSNLSGGLVLVATASAPLRFGTNETERGQFTSGGQLVLAPLALTQASPTAIDFNLANERDLTTTGAIEFTTSNLAAGRSVTIYITAGADTDFTFPAWDWQGNAAPASLANGETATLTLSSRSTTDGAVRAAYAARP